MHRSTLIAVFALAALFLAFTQPALAGDVILRAQCAITTGEYVESGTWVDAGSEADLPDHPPCKPGSRSTLEAGAYAEFAPHVPEAGSYAVYVMWGTTTATNHGPNAENVTFTITDSEGSRSVVLNQRGKNSYTDINSNLWVAIGSGIFTPDGAGTIRIINTADGGCYDGPTKYYVNVDAVRLTSLEPLPAVPTTWGVLKNLYR